MSTPPLLQRQQMRARKLFEHKVKTTGLDELRMGELLEQAPAAMRILPTGRDVHLGLIVLAGTVAEMPCIKHSPEED